MRKLLFSLFCLVSLGVNAQTTAMETDYNALAARFSGRDKLLQRDLKNYLQTYPYTTYENEVMFMQGVLQIEKEHYKQGLKILEIVDVKALQRDHQYDYSFYCGYAYLMSDEYKRAAGYFSKLSKAEEGRHALRGSYYYAYCMYKMQRYDEALPIFRQLEKTPEYQKTVPFYLVQICYAKGEYEEAAQKAAVLAVKDMFHCNNPELISLE